ncbi:MAG: hypothetical protein WBO17_00925 [Sphingorhabdus sp.]
MPTFNPASIIAIFSLGVATTAPLSAETRIIVEPHRVTGDQGFSFQNHDTQTPFVRPGATIEVDRSTDFYVWVYQHGIDLLPTSVVTTNAALTGAQFTSVGGTLSKVFLPLVGSFLGAAGARAYKFNAGRNLEIGSAQVITLKIPTGDITLRTNLRCGTDANEVLSSLASVSAADTAVQAGNQSTLTIRLDRAPPCQKQPIRIVLPPCFQSAKTENGVRFVSQLLMMEPSDKAVLNLPLFASETGTPGCEPSTGNISVTVNNVTKSVAIRYFLPLSAVPKAQPLIPGIPGALKPASPVRPGGTVVPKPKPIGG